MVAWGGDGQWGMCRRGDGRDGTRGGTYGGLLVLGQVGQHPDGVLPLVLVPADERPAAAGELEQRDQARRGHRGPRCWGKRESR